MSLPSYTELAARINVRQCRGLTPDGHTCVEDHELGRYEWRTLGGSVIHWADRRPTYAGIRRFLWVIAWAVNGPSPLGPIHPYWRRFYLSQMTLNRLAQLGRVRIPKALSAEDRAKMRALIVDVPRREPGREEARMWARR